jgi:hypothetical protein
MSNYNLKPVYEGVDELTTRDRAMTILYGRQPDAIGGKIVPIEVDGAGKLVIGTGLTLTASDIDIGDFVMKGVTDPSLKGDVYTPGEERIGLIRVGDASAPNTNLYEILVRDPRFSFDSNNRLSVNVNNTGSSVQHFNAIATIAPAPVIFAATSKSILIENVNAAVNDLYVSFDGGINYKRIKQNETIGLEVELPSMMIKTLAGTTNYEILVVE